jgi:hypothetical protein
MVGLLAAALYAPIWTGSVQHLTDASISRLCLAFLVANKVPPIFAVALCERFFQRGFAQLVLSHPPS